MHLDFQCMAELNPNHLVPIAHAKTSIRAKTEFLKLPFRVDPFLDMDLRSPLLQTPVFHNANLIKKALTHMGLCIFILRELIN